MGYLIPTDSIGTPTRWLLVFDRQASSWWADLVAMGRYKHVRAFGWVAASDAWIFYDVQFGRTILSVARGDGARRLMLEWCGDADVLVVSNPGQKVHLLTRFPVPLLCTTSIAHLIGLPGRALRPDALYRKAIRNGAIRIGRTKGTTDHARPDVAAAHEDCAAAAGAGASD